MATRTAQSIRTGHKLRELRQVVGLIHTTIGRRAPKGCYCIQGECCLAGGYLRAALECARSSSAT